MDSIPNDLLDLKARFDQWRANRKYKREPIPGELRNAALEISRHYPPSLLRQVLKVDPWRLRPKAKAKAPRSRRQAALTAFFKLPPPATAQPPAESLPSQPSTDCRLQIERTDGSRLTLTLPSLDASALNALLADFLRGSSR